MYNYDLMIHAACNGDITRRHAVMWQIPYVDVYKTLCITEYLNNKAKAK